MNKKEHVELLLFLNEIKPKISKEYRWEFDRQFSILKNLIENDNNNTEIKLILKKICGSLIKYFISP